MAGCRSDPHKFIQEIHLAGAGYLEVLSIAHDHLTPISPDILFDLIQIALIVIIYASLIWVVAPDISTNNLTQIFIFLAALDLEMLIRELIAFKTSIRVGVIR